MSALASLTKAQLIALIESAPAAAVTAKTFYTKTEIANGAGFPCTAKPACSRLLGTEKRATIHGTAIGGHVAR